MSDTQDMSTAEVRRNLAAVINGAIRGETTFITSRGYRVAAVVPAPEAERNTSPSAHDSQEEGTGQQ